MTAKGSDSYKPAGSSEIPSLAEVSRILSQSSVEQLPRVDVVVLRNIVVEPFAPCLRYLGYREGLNCTVRFGGYDTIVQDALGQDDSVLGPNTDCIIVVMRLEGISWHIARNFPSLDAQAVRTEVARIEACIETVIQGIRNRTKATILWHGFELPTFASYGIWDRQGDSGHVDTILSLNARLRQALRSVDDAYFVDVNACLARIGYLNSYDQRYWHLGRAPYSMAAVKEIAAEDIKFIRALRGKSRKCLVLDCDNVLWGGIIGEDGPAGIALGQSFPGSAYHEFQQEVANLCHRGVILALCSKNNEADVWQVFRSHPDMVLREEQVSACQINWDDKALNLRRIAVELNIGLDGLVFMDDSEHEIALVRRELPEVETVLLPGERPAEYRDMLAGCGLFDTLSLTEEDRQRGSLYRAESQRRKLELVATDITSYLRSLDMILDIRLADAMSVPRVAQLTQRTNQFNLTGRRHTKAEIAGLLDNDAWDVITLRVSDRFGDAGIVGACMLRYGGEDATIDDFLLSCRVLGREIEKAFLSRILTRAKARGARSVIGEYVATKKNALVGDFYSGCGFAVINDSKSGDGRAMRFDLTNDIGFEPQVFRQIITEWDILRGEDRTSGKARAG